MMMMPMATATCEAETKLVAPLVALSGKAVALLPVKAAAEDDEEAGPEVSLCDDVVTVAQTHLTSLVEETLVIDVSLVALVMVFVADPKLESED